jgi:hypothetical protein
MPVESGAAARAIKLGLHTLTGGCIVRRCKLLPTRENGARNASDDTPGMERFGRKGPAGWPPLMTF